MTRAQNRQPPPHRRNRVVPTTERGRGADKLTHTGLRLRMADPSCVAFAPHVKMRFPSTGLLGSSGLECDIMRTGFVLRRLGNSGLAC